MSRSRATQLDHSPRPRAVVFDMDGLMFNTEDLYTDVGDQLLGRRGHRFTAELKDAMMGRPGPIALQIMIDWHQLDATVDQLAAESDLVFAEILATRLDTMPGLLELLAALERAGIPKAIATSSRRTFAQSVLSRFDLERRFSFLLTAEDVREGKPAPEIYLTAAARLGVVPGDVLVLEDSANGFQSALRAGTIAVAVPAGHSLRHDFTGARLVAKSLLDPRLYGLLRLVADA